ncbi:hypothetical protein HHI36_005507 [Cryptolaemus montrouzieri]|uniref:Uncharacterized protein n=1 Tax=Cryptolaemus montrouzieri TaxID=559131 RepID=A0ABD2NVY1_9CUCU
MNYSVADYLQERKSVDMISKFTTQILKHFREMHNFTYILFVRDKWYGNDKFGYEDGVAKDIQEETIDFAGAVAVVKYPRLLVYDFINPTYRFSAAFIFRNIQQHDLWENEFLKPFSTGTWLSILFVLTLLSALLKITNWLENTYMRTTNRYSIFTTILIVLSILCQQGKE